MHDFRDIVQIDKKFQKSINMRLDYNKADKIASYIPTSASVQILKEYLGQFVKNEGQKSTILIGPYGKGKSHLLLILLALLSKKNQESKQTKIKKILQQVIAKIENKDNEAGAYAAALVRENKCYLPVIISGVQSDLRRAMLLALREGLQREGLEHIVPNTYYEEALKTTSQWKKDYPDTYKKFLQCLQEKKIQESVFLKEIKNYKEESLRTFQEIYPLLTAGSIFEPMVQMDEISLFKSVNEKLCKEYGYQGIVLVFDEFSKFVEGYPKENFAGAMELLQNLCELANSSQKEKMHVILVAHKAMKEYKNNLPDEVINAYMGVEGRISEIYFTTSLKNSYELIQNVLIKKQELFQKEVLETKQFQKLCDNSYHIPYFHTLFTEEEFRAVVAEGCFPLTPVAAYLLLKISEKAVQNERTVFTFLTNDEPHSLVSYMEQKKEFQGEYVTGGEVYDYFSKMLKSDSANVVMHNEWLKAEYALQSELSKEEKQVVKTIALIRMVGKQDEVFAQDEVIRLGAGLAKEDYETAIEQLKDKQIILFRSKLGSYAFKNNIGVDLEKEIEKVVQAKLQKINLCEELKKISELEFEIPKRYNLLYTMTRYFHYHFMTVDSFMHLKTTDYLFEDKFADGKIVALIRENETSKEAISKHLQELQDKRVLVIYPEEMFMQTKLLKKIMAIQMLKQSEEFLENNKALEQELGLYEEDLTFELNMWLEQYFLPLNGKCYVLYDGAVYEKTEFSMQKSDSKFNQFLSGIMEEYYCCTPKINNEMINKCNLTSQMNKVRRKIMEQLFEKKDFWEYRKGTSPEATIFRAVFLKTGVMELSNGQEVYSYSKDEGVERILKEIKDFIHNAAGVKQNFSILYKTLAGEKFGVRKGVLPFYIVYSLTQMTEMPIIYLDEKEVLLEPQIFENINEAPEKYWLYMEKETMEKEVYLSGLEKIFTDLQNSFGNKQNRLQKISDGMYQWFCSLPQCAKNYSLDERKSNEQAGIKLLRGAFSKIERNPREILLERLPEAFEEMNYQNLLEQIETVKQEMDIYAVNLKNQAASITRKVFQLSEKNDLQQGLKAWYQNQSDTAKSHVSTQKIERFMSEIQELSTHDENEIVERISKIVLDLYIEDWKENSIYQYEDGLNDIKDEVEKIQEEKPEEGSQKLIFTNSQGIEVKKYFQISEEDGTSQFLQNEIESALEEYGDCLETNQKISVMVRMIEKLLEG